MKIAARTHPKLYDLCDRLKCSRPTAIGYLELLWAGTADHAPAGDIGRFTDGAISRWSDWTGEPSEFVAALVESGWIDCDEVHRLVVHNWADHCPNWVKAKMKKSGAKFACTSEASIEPTNDASNVGTAEPSNVPSNAATNAPSNAATTSQAKPSLTKSSPATPPPYQFADANRWTMAGGVVGSFGLGTARERVERCRDAGIPVEQIEEVLEFWRSHSGDFDGVGALGVKLDRIVLGQPVSDGWPKRTKRPTSSADIAAERDAVLALGDDELNALAAEAFAGKPGLMMNWKEIGRSASVCIDAISKFRISSRNGGS